MIRAEWIAPRRTALLLVDMQRDFAASDGAMGRAGGDLSAVAAAVAEAARLADAARGAGVPCVFTRVVTRAADETGFLREWNARRGDGAPPLCREGTPGADFVGPRPGPCELVFTKRRYDAFHGTGLDAALRGAGRDTLVVAGLTTECCVDSTVRAAFERDYHVFVVTDATACYAPDLHEAALRAMALNCAGLAAAADVCGAWKAQ